MMKLVRTAKAVPGKKAAPSKVAAKKSAARPRYDDDDDDDDDETYVDRRGSRGAERGEALPAASPRGSVKGGRAEADLVFAGGDFATNLKLSDGEEKVIRFLQDDPYASMRIHWVRGRPGKQSFPCHGDFKKELAKNGCPMCQYGMEYRAEARYNVAVLTEDEPIVSSLSAGPRNRKKIDAHHSSKHGPLTRKYYFYRRTGSKFNDTEYNFDVVRTPEHISEDYPKLYIPTEDELDDLVLFTKEHANKEFSSLADMRKIALEVVSGDDADEDED